MSSNQDIILITGATGFVGSHLLEKVLKETNVLIRCFVRTGSNFKSNNSRITVFQGDLTSSKDWQKAVDGVRLIYHIAGLGLSRLKEDPEFNRASVRALVKANENIHTDIPIVYLSSLKAAQPSLNMRGIDEAVASKPTDLYGVSKREGELELLNSQLSRYLILRPPAIYGPRDTNLLPIFKFVSRGWNIEFTGNKITHFSLVYVEDLAMCMTHLIKEPYLIDKNVLFLTNKNPCTWNEFLSEISSSAKVNKNRKKVNTSFIYPVLNVSSVILKIIGKSSILPTERVKDLLVYNWTCSSQKAETEYNLKCSTSLSEGVEKTLSWYKNNNWI